MQLTGKEIIRRGIITNACEDGVQQQGIDVRIDNIFKTSPGGFVPATGKTFVPPTSRLVCSHTSLVKDSAGVYVLAPGYYEVDLMEGCEIPNDAVLNFKTRSSLVRNGAIVHSGQFDAGFKTDRMGCFLHVINNISIEKGARIAQAIVTETHEVADCDSYNGQWQGDCQRDRSSLTT